MSRKTDADIAEMARRFVEMRSQPYFEYLDRSIRVWMAKALSDAWMDGYRRARRDHGLDKRVKP